MSADTNCRTDTCGEPVDFTFFVNTIVQFPQLCSCSNNSCLVFNTDINVSKVEHVKDDKIRFG
ncbi:hypothetical protein HanIR_Chr12g0575441 [Helianthus annuus]|nr:hypothetical protein HanIR_Chr12g0575441 [Helianthus annuus]